jgi:hypothetical protein
LARIFVAGEVLFTIGEQLFAVGACASLQADEGGDLFAEVGIGYPSPATERARSCNAKTALLGALRRVPIFY